MGTLTDFIKNNGGQILKTGGNVLGSYLTKNAISDAYETSAGGYTQGINFLQDTANKSIGAFGQVYNQSREDIQPFYNAGTNSLGQYMGLLDDPSSIRQDPGYEFRFNEGQRSLERGAAARGYTGSGNVLHYLQDYGQNTATAEYDSALNRRVPIIQTGQNALSQLNYAGRTFAGGVANVNNALGAGVSNAMINRGEALSNVDLAKGGFVQDILDIGGDFISGVGLADKAGNFMSDIAGGGDWWNFGGDVSSVAGAGSVGSGVGTMFPGAEAGVAGTSAASGAALTGSLGTSVAGEGALGVTGMGEGFGGSYALGEGALASTEIGGAAGAAPAATGFLQGLGYTAAGFAALAAVRWGVMAFRGPKTVMGTLKDAAKSDDPISDVLNRPDKDFGGIVPREEYRYGNGVDNGIGRGMALSMMVGSMENPSTLMYHKNGNEAVGMIKSAWTQGASMNGKVGDMDASPGAALTKLFPEIADDINTWSTYKQNEIAQDGLDDTSTGSLLESMGSRNRKATARERRRTANQARGRVDSYIDNKMSEWTVSRSATKQLIALEQ